jgi:hypothetical protein
LEAFKKEEERRKKEAEKSFKQQSIRDKRSAQRALQQAHKESNSRENEVQRLLRNLEKVEAEQERQAARKFVQRQRLDEGLRKLREERYGVEQQYEAKLAESGEARGRLELLDSALKAKEEEERPDNAEPEFDISPEEAMERAQQEMIKTEIAQTRMRIQSLSNDNGRLRQELGELRRIVALRRHKVFEVQPTASASVPVLPSWPALSMTRAPSTTSLPMTTSVVTASPSTTSLPLAMPASLSTTTLPITTTVLTAPPSTTSLPIASAPPLVRYTGPSTALPINSSPLLAWSTPAVEGTGRFPVPLGGRALPMLAPAAPIGGNVPSSTSPVELIAKTVTPGAAASNAPAQTAMSRISSPSAINNDENHYLQKYSGDGGGALPGKNYGEKTHHAHEHVGHGGYYGEAHRASDGPRQHAGANDGKALAASSPEKASGAPVVAHEKWGRLRDTALHHQHSPPDDTSAKGDQLYQVVKEVTAEALREYREANG